MLSGLVFAESDHVTLIPITWRQPFWLLNNNYFLLYGDLFIIHEG